MYIPLERKCVREDPNKRDNVKNRIAHRPHNVTTYAWVLSDTFSFQWDIVSQPNKSFCRGFRPHWIETLDSYTFHILEQF